MEYRMHGAVAAAADSYQLMPHLKWERAIEGGWSEPRSLLQLVPMKGRTKIQRGRRCLCGEQTVCNAHVGERAKR